MNIYIVFIYIYILNRGFLEQVTLMISVLILVVCSKLL